MNKYESLYVITPELEDADFQAVIEKFAGIVTANKGEVEKIDQWGKRRLAYEIDYKTEGYYVLMLFQAPGELPAELERNFKNDERIMRFVVVRREA